MPLKGNVSRAISISANSERDSLAISALSSNRRRDGIDPLCGHDARTEGLTSPPPDTLSDSRELGAFSRICDQIRKASGVTLMILFRQPNVRNPLRDRGG